MAPPSALAGLTLVFLTVVSGKSEAYASGNDEMSDWYCQQAPGVEAFSAELLGCVYGEEAEDDCRRYIDHRSLPNQVIT